MGHRTLQVNGRYIRDHGTPNYGAKAASMAGAVPIPGPEKGTQGTTGATADLLTVGTEVDLIGKRHYASSYATAEGKHCKAGRAKITAVAVGKPHLYHCVAVSGKDSTVYGWVKAEGVQAVTTNAIQKGDRVKVLKATTYSGGSFKAYFDAYDVIQVNGDQVVIGQGKTAVNSANLQVV